MKGHRRARGSIVRRQQYDRLRAMYVGGRGNATARRYARFWNMALRLGLLPRRGVTLEVRGRRTGRVTRFPLGMADVGGRWYVGSTLVEVPVEERAPVIRRYVGRVPGGRPHIPVDRHEPVEAFETIASNYPVFRVVPL